MIIGIVQSDHWRVPKGNAAGPNELPKLELSGRGQQTDSSGLGSFGKGYRGEDGVFM